MQILKIFAVAFENNISVISNLFNDFLNGSLVASVKIRNKAYKIFDSSHFYVSFCCIALILSF